MNGSKINMSELHVEYALSLFVNTNIAIHISKEQRRKNAWFVINNIETDNDRQQVSKYFQFLTELEDANCTLPKSPEALTKMYNNAVD